MNTLIKFFLFLLILFSSFNNTLAAYLHKEAEYQAKWCQEMNGTKEYKLEDKTRVDCLTQTHAIEFDFAKKVYESIGQALYYGIMTNRKPGIVLIVENPLNDIKYINRMKPVAKSNNIDCWVMYVEDLNNFQIHPLY